MNWERLFFTLVGASVAVIVMGLLMKKCSGEIPVATTTEIIKWRSEIQKIHDTLTQVQVRREQLAGRVDTLVKYVDRMDSAQADSCIKGVAAKTLCEAYLLRPVHEAQILTSDTLIGLQSREINFKDSISASQDKTIAAQAKTINNRSTGLKWAKRGYIALTGLFIYLYIKK